MEGLGHESIEFFHYTDVQVPHLLGSEWCMFSYLVAQSKNTWSIDSFGNLYKAFLALENEDYSLISYIHLAQ